jgi:hypothetical protein
MAPLVSAAGFLALLQEPEPELQAHALVNLNNVVDQLWMEIADAVSTMYKQSSHVLMCAVRSYTKMKSSQNDSWPR